MYHFFSAVGGAVTWPLDVMGCPLPSAFSVCSIGGADSSADSDSWGSFGPALSINQLRDVRPHEVEQTENDGRNDRHDDDDQRCRADFLRARPRDLLELRRHLVGEAVILVAAI